MRRSAPPPRSSERWWVRLRLLGLCLSLALLVVWARGLWSPRAEGAYDDSLVASLAVEGLTVDARSIRWTRAPGGLFGWAGAFFLAARGDELPDLYYADVRTSAPDAVLDTWFLTNLSHSSAAAETELVRVGEHLAYASRVGDLFDAVVLVDMRGEDPALTADWPRVTRLQNAITNLQETGRLRGVGFQRFSLMPPAETLTLSVSGGRLSAAADGERIVIDPLTGATPAGAHRVQPRLVSKGRPGRLTWVVDTVRNLSFVGPEPIEWLEHTVFGLTDRANRAYHDVVGTDTEAEVVAALGADVLARAQVPEPVADDEQAPEQGPSDWPPAALEPVLDGVVRGEGQWLLLRSDPFILHDAQAPAAFAQTFIRVDPEREFTRVYITAWDPRQVQLHIAMGTREPISATGETATGRVPDDPQLVERLVGGFNGGFQALHGEFGMMAEGRVYLPPKPFAATVATYEDGTVAMGSWPGPGRNAWDEEFANSQIPAGMLSMRQNLTSVVEDGEYNPWKRWWWGAAPTWAEEQTYIHRSGLCLTEEGFFAYFWGESMGPEALGAAMLAARCARGMHLDMNSKHTGLEFYRPRRLSGAPFEPLEHPLSDAEFQGRIAGMAGFEFRARKAVRTMTPLRFPRYLEEDPRDFFFLSLKSVLPGQPLRYGTQAQPFRSAGLPTTGWPHPFARTEITTADGLGTWLVRMDANRLALLPEQAGEPTPPLAEGKQPPTAPPPLAYLVGLAADVASGGPVCLSLPRRHGRVWPALGVCTAEDDPRVWLRGTPLTEDGPAQAAVGVDGDGFLVYAERRGGTAAALTAWLSRAGVQQALALPEGVRLVFADPDGGPGLGADGQPLRRPLAVSGALALRPRSAPVARVLHPEIQPRPYRVWGWLQGQRVRYFPEGEPRFKAPEGTP